MSPCIFGISEKGIVVLFVRTLLLAMIGVITGEVSCAGKQSPPQPQNCKKLGSDLPRALGYGYRSFYQPFSAPYFSVIVFLL